MSTSIIIKEFNKNITFLLNSILSKLPKDDDLLQIKNQYSIARNNAPSLIITEAGPYLLRFKKQILNKEINYFVNDDTFRNEVSSLSSSDINILSILNKLQLAFNDFTEAEQDIIIAKIQSMLLAYEDFIKSQ